jgi:hypothetical protein
VFAIGAIPRLPFLKKLLRSKAAPSKKSSKISKDELVCAPNVTVQKPFGVNSVIYLLSIFWYIPFAIPFTLGEFVSSTKTLSSANDGTSYHLLGLLINSLSAGVVVKVVPALCIIDSTDKMLFSGNVIL